MGGAALLVVIVVVGILLVALGVLGSSTTASEPLSATAAQPTTGGLIEPASDELGETTEPVSASSEDESATVTPRPIPTETPIPYPSVAPYDTFDDPAYDGSFNPNLWSRPEEPCIPTQTDGVMSFSFETTAPAGAGTGCSLIANPSTLPPLGNDLQSMWMRMQIPGDRDPYFIGVNAQYLTQFTGGGYYSVTCGIHGWQPTEMGIVLEVTDGRLPDSEAQMYWQDYPVIQHDRWYTVHLQVDPTSMTFSCELDGETVGNFTPANAEELANQRWDYQVFAWRDRGTATNIRALVDDFYFIPTGQ